MTGVALGPGLHANCPTRDCGAPLTVPAMTPADDKEPCLNMAADMTCGACGGIHRILISMIPNVDQTILYT